MRSLIVLTLTILFISGCGQQNPKLTSFIPMECEHLISKYKVRWTNPSAIMLDMTTSSKVVVKNEIDGLLVTLTPESESDWVCKKLGNEIKLK